MGQLISYFGSKNEPVDIFLDLEGSQPTENEAKLFAKMNTILEKAPPILKDLKNYKGCSELIRKYISSAESFESESWKEIDDNIQKLKKFYDFSEELGSAVIELLLPLSSSDIEGLTSQQAIARQLCLLFDFVLKFDDLKMTTPAIQNDFSFYRRENSKQKAKDSGVSFSSMSNEVANKMSLFYAYPTPMMKCITDTISMFLSKQDEVRSNILSCLALFANICYSMVEKKRVSDSDLCIFCLRSMTASIVLYDHISELGAFSKKSPIQIKNCVLKLKENENTTSLFNVIRFTSKHLNDAETPSSIQALFS
eukprot:GCRY01000780.1.p1 GENE.GCRY01000780.1~~GCRY01000780.1.p1  ORF type:complete len:310 (+),score=36.01 GCRY01000780.1:124-1053(+)